MAGYFHWADYAICALSLLLSLACGIYSAWTHRAKGTLDEFALGSRGMSPVLIGISLVATLADPATIILFPVEVYMFGCIVAMLSLGIAMNVLFSLNFIIPTFRKMLLTSVYEYIEYRFNSKFLRLMASMMFIIFILLGGGLVLYVPALAFTQVTGLPLWVPTVIFGGTCIVYTSMGGFRAVIMVDALQMTAMLGSVFLVIILGTIQAGGVAAVVEKARTGGRFNFNSFTLDPRVRYTLWSGSFGHFFYAMAVICAGQMSVQRFLSVKDDKSLKRMGWMALCLAFVATFLASMQGLVVYAYYSGCDPIINQKIKRPEQLLPYFIMDLVGHLPGLPGLYIACLFAAAMSTLSSAVNSVTTLVIQDIIRPIMMRRMDRNLSSAETKVFCTVLSTIIGCISMLAAFLPEAIGGLVIEMNRLITVGALVPILAIFMLGIFIPWADIWGAYAGWMTSTILGLWLGIGNNLYGHTSRRMLPLSTDSCPAEHLNVFNSTTSTYTVQSSYVDSSVIAPFTTDLPADQSSESLLQSIYNISYVWVSMYALLGGVIVGSVVSFFTSGQSFLRHPKVKADWVFEYKCCQRSSNDNGSISEKIKKSPYNKRSPIYKGKNGHDYQEASTIHLDKEEDDDEYTLV